MSVLRAIERRAVERRDSYPPQWVAAIFGDEGPTSSGESVGKESALKFAAFYSAVDLISRALAFIPLVLMRHLSREGQERAYTHGVYDLIHTSPNPEQTSFVWRQDMQSRVLRWGNAYSEIVRNGTGRPTALWPIPPDEMQVTRSPGGDLLYTQRHNGQVTHTWSAEDILHLRTMGDGIIGKSPVRLFADGLGLALAAERAGASFFRNGMRPSGTLEHPRRLGDLAQKHLKESMAAVHAGSQNFGTFLVLEEGMKWNALSIAPEDAQFLQTRVFQVRDVGRIFHIPLHKLGDLERATFSNIEEQNIEWATDCLGPWIVNWEQELDRKLLLPGERSKFSTHFVLEGLLRGNTAARAAFYKTMSEIGAYSINDIRSLESQNPIGPEGDEHYVPLNVTTAKLAAIGPLPKPELAPKALPPPADGTPAKDQHAASAHRELLLDTAGRLVRMEAGAIRKALRHPQRFAHELEEIIGREHELHAVKILLPASAAYRAFATGNGHDGSTAEYLCALVREHITKLRARLLSNRDPSAEIMLWERSAPQEMTERLMAELAKEY